MRQSWHDYTGMDIPPTNLDGVTTSFGKTPQLDNERLKNLVSGIFSTHPDEITCDDCFEQVGIFAELVLAGKNAAEALPLVQDHLNRCQECHKEFEMLLDALRVISGHD